MEHATKDYHIIADISNQAYINQEQMKDKWKDEYSFYKKAITNFVTKYPKAKLNIITSTFASLSFPFLIIPLKLIPDIPNAAKKQLENKA